MNTKTYRGVPVWVEKQGESAYYSYLIWQGETRRGDLMVSEQDAWETVEDSVDYLKSKNWGGYRPGAGRKKENIEPTKVVRLPESQAQFVKSGKLDELLALLTDWEQRSQEASSTSPRWQKARELLSEIQEIL